MAQHSYDVFEQDGRPLLQKVDEAGVFATDMAAMIQFVMDLEAGDAHAIACAKQLLESHERK